MTQLSSKSYFPPVLLFFLSSLGFAAVESLPRSPVLAQTSSIPSITVTESVGGNDLYIQGQPARINGVVQSGQLLQTDQSRAAFNVGPNTIARVGEDSSVLVQRDCLQLQRGELLISGLVGSCTPSLGINSNNATYIIDIDKNGDQILKVLEGDVVLSPLNQPNTTLLTLKPGQEVFLSPRGDVVRVERLDRTDYVKILESALFDDFSVPLPRLLYLRDAYTALYPGTVFPLQVAVTPTRTTTTTHTTTTTVRLAPADLQRAKNLARQAAESANGGLGRYRAEQAMHGPVSGAPLEINDDGTITFTFHGGRPGLEDTAPTVESVVTVNPVNWDIDMNYNGPIR